MKQNKDYIFGTFPVIEAIEAGKQVDKVFLHKGDIKSFTQLVKLLKEHDIYFQTVPVEKLNRITRANHQGVIAFISPIEYYNLEQLIPSLFEKGKDPFILVLDQLTDVRNFGAIARTAECAGVDAIVIPQKGSVTITPDAIKASAGGLNRVPVCKVNSLYQAVKFLKDSGIRLIGASEKTKENYFESSYLSPLAVVMGSEEKGISDQIQRELDCQIKIPMLGNIKSLNVSVATGIILFEIVKQKMAADMVKTNHF